MAVKRISVSEFNKIRNKPGTAKKSMTQKELEANRKRNRELSIPLTTADGKEFGKVSYLAYQAIMSSNLDNYEAVNAEERKALNQFRTQESVPITTKNGENIGYVSYDAYVALSKNKIDGYKPKSDSEKATINKYKSYAEAYTADSLGGGLKFYGEAGQYGKGNIDLYKLPQSKTSNDSGSPEGMKAFKVDGKYVLLPTTVYDEKGKVKTLSDDEALKRYETTGGHLGKFDTLYESDAYAQKLSVAQNFYHNSRYKTTKNGKEAYFSGWVNQYTETGYDDLIYDAINKNEDAVSILNANDIALGGTLAGVDSGFLQTMTSDEVLVFNYIYSTQGKDKAYEFIENISSDLNYRQRLETEKMWSDMANESPVKTSAFSVLISPLKAASYVGQVADYVDDGHIDQNAGYNKYSHIPTAIRSTVSTNIESKWGKAGSWTYNLGMSMADSIYNTAITGGYSGYGGLSLAIMGAGAAADTVISAKDKGLSDTQAFWLGTIAGAAEVVSEKLSLDAILDANLFTKSAMKYFVKSATVGGLEEVVADGINYAADYAIAGDKSSWSQSIKTYMDNGKSKSEAVGLTIGEGLLDTALTFVGGAISTGTMSVGGTVYNATRIKNVGKAHNSDAEISEIIETGLNQSKDSTAYKNAVALQSKYETDGVTDYEIGQQFLLNEGATISKDTKERSKKAKELLSKFSSYIRKPDAVSETKARAVPTDEIDTTPTVSTDEVKHTKSYTEPISSENTETSPDVNVASDTPEIKSPDADVSTTPTSELDDIAEEKMQSQPKITAPGEIVTLTRTKNLYGAFKGAKRIVVGQDVITDGYIAIPKTDEASAEIAKVVNVDFKNSATLTMSKFDNKSNDVVIQGDPKVFEIKNSKDSQKLKIYAFEIDGKIYMCQQKYLDALNNGENIITANENLTTAWMVRDKEGNLIAAISAILPTNERIAIYNDAPYASEVLETKKKGNGNNEMNTITEKATGYVKDPLQDESKYVERNSLTSAVPNDTLNLENVESIPSESGVKFSVDESGQDADDSHAQRLLSKHIVYARTYLSMRHDETISRLYDEAKKGNYDSAAELVNSLVDDKYVENLTNAYGNNSIVIPVVGMENISDNVIPYVMSDYLSKAHKMSTFLGVYKTSKNNMTDKSSIRRLKEEVVFDFTDGYSQSDVAGKHFVIADDTITTGTTTMALAEFITKNGGYVDGFIALCKGRDKVNDMEVTDENYNKLLEVAKGAGYNEETVQSATRWITDRAAKGYIKEPEKWFSYLEQRRGDGYTKRATTQSVGSSRQNVSSKIEGEKIKPSSSTYSEESEANNNVRTSILSEDIGRRDNESAGEQTQRISEFRRQNQGKTESERKGIAKELRAKGQISQEIIENVRIDVVKPEAYNDDMMSIVSSYKEKGIDVKLFVGNGVYRFDTKRNFKIDGFKISDTEIYLRYDGKFAPQTLGLHERIHIDWNSDSVQKAKDIILNNLSENEKNKILASDRYQKYMTLYKGDKDAVWQEFVADVFAGMNDYTSDYIELVTDYWNGNEIIDRYSPAEYTESIDSGGTNDAIVDDIGFGDGNKLQERNDAPHGTDPEGLGRNGTGENNNSLWQRSDGSKEVYSNMGINTQTLRRSQESGYRYIDWGRILGDIDVYGTKEKGYAYDILRKISGISVSNTDQLGRTVTQEQQQYFAKTVAKNSDGKLIPLYHATDNHFETFEFGDFGYHVGNPNQAIDMDKQYIKEVFVNIANPVFIEFDMGAWAGDDVAFALREQDIISQEQYDNLSAMDGFYDTDSQSEANVAIKELLKSKGFDGIVYRNGYEAEGLSFIAFDSNQIKYTSNANPTTNPDIRYSIDPESEFYDGEYDLFDVAEGTVDKPEFEWLREKYGIIPKGENPVRDVSVPKKITEDKVVSRFARTMMEAGVTPDDSVSKFEKAILDGTMTHEVITNQNARNWAVQQIKYHGFEEALNKWTVLSESGKIGKNELALGMELYNQCITNKDVHNAMKIAAELVAEATRAGQTLQATRMLKLMTPDGQLYYLEKSIQKMNDEFRNKIGDKYKDIKLDEDLVKDFLTEKDEVKRNEAYDKLCQNIADQIPATKLDKWNSWRYLAMLGNLRTHIRNIVGNAIFVPSVRIKNYIGAVIERAAKVQQEDRTKSLRKSKEAVEFAKKDFDTMARVLQGENAKYAVTSDIEGKRTIFKTKWLEKLRLKNFDFLEKEDIWFLKRHYVDSLARVITARGINTTSIDSQTLEKIRAYAVKEAQAATYRDANTLAEGLSKLQRKLERSDSKSVRASSVLVEGVMPFKKTPINIAKQGINYSPIGILKGTYKALKNLNNGKATSADVIDDLSKGLTGTGVMLLGLWLASMGLIVGADDESKKEKEFNKMVGEQSYAVKIKDGFSYTIDWMVPSNLSLFIGVKLYELTKDDFSFADVVDALSTVTEPLLELSVFSGLNGVIESAQYSDSEALFAIGSDMVTSYLLQALPTMGGQLSRIIDGNKREYYYTDKNSNMPKSLQRLIGQASSKIPFASYLFEPAIDEWGREEKHGNILERVFENVVSPGYYAEDNYTAVDKELKDLYERTGESSVLPVTQQKYYKENKIYYYMSAEEYTEVKKMRGQKSFKYVESLINSSAYKAMPDEEKVKAVKACYDRAGKETKDAMLEKVKNKSK